MYLAAGWMVFGRSLEVSHFLMLPFVAGALWQLLRLSGFFFTSNALKYGAAVLLALDATVISQLSLVTFEVMHLFFFLLAVNAVLRDEKWMLTWAVAGLALVSLRSAMSAIGVGTTVLLVNYILRRRLAFHSIFPFVPGLLIFGSFILAFYLEKGWVVHNTVSNKWAEAGKLSESYDVLRNSLIFFWRTFDFGRIAYLVILCFAGVHIFRKRMLSKKQKMLLLISLGQFIIFFGVLVIYKNSINPRYLIPFYLPLMLFAISYLAEHNNKTRNLIMLGVWTAAGYFTQYPIRTAMAWDGTPNHWVYYGMRNEMKKFISEQQLPFDQVGTSFPNAANFKNTELSNGKEGFADLDLQNQQYVLFSNVFNERDQVINELLVSGRWQKLKTLEKNGIFMVLLKKN